MLQRSPRALPVLQRKCAPTPTLAAALTFGTSWKVLGLNSNESRTRFAPSASRPVICSSRVRSTVTTPAPPRVQKGRTLSAWGLSVSVPSATNRPKSTKAQGRASNAPVRKRTGHASSVAASSTNDALPPGAWKSERHAWRTPSTNVGDQRLPRSTPTVANSATAGMTPGATPTIPSAASCAANVVRARGVEPPSRSLPAEASAFERAAGGFDAAVEGAPVELVAPFAESPWSERGASAVVALGVAAWSADVGSSVTAIISAAASTASLQLCAGTWRVTAFVPGFASVTSEDTAPDGSIEIWTRIKSPLPSTTNRTLGERARTRAIRSARVAQPASAANSRLADAIGASDSAAATARPAEYESKAISSALRRARVLVNACGGIA